MFDPPIGLSDLPGYQTAASTRPARTAFIGRCSTKDNQDPRSSIAGQLAEASALLTPGEEFAAYFWDVESGMLGLDERSQGSADDYARLGVPVPRDGGLRELLEWVERGEIDRVVCERIGRVARDMLPSLQVEHHLASRGVRLECANEPRGGMTTGQLGLRRAEQVRAEITRHELLEMSMRGQRQHAANGYRHGPPCYGYIAVVDPDAPPAANRFGGGRPKMRLALHPDSRRVETVQEVFRLRRVERLGDGEILRMLAADLDQHPLAAGQVLWRRARVQRMLAQPKYTGYQVFNRCAARTNRGRSNPIADWVWSREPAHPMIVPLGEWRETQLVTARLRERRISGWERVNAAAAQRGIRLTPVRESDTHLLYEAAGRRLVLPRGELPAAVADEVIALLEVGA
ncbi:recombinase family protein [Planomonospora sp. ID91781]|uniref:recombinase family protein n=1 Tax=Planomonospora sp. ID91781 TaxID=2738135 RepID=UPI0018C4230F|nr:recombinase family protein [Planomonospora sp. ID91781]MBG0825831.1 recombinase family protein [Planomonospora sp. ID91781]